MSTAALVLAAGSGSRFSGQPGEKLLAPVGGQAMLARVLTTLRDFGPATTVVVLGHGAETIEAAIEWAAEIRVRNPAPGRGIASSVTVGFNTLAGSSLAVDGAFVVLADQPNLRVATLHALAHAAVDPATADRMLIVPRYTDDPGPRNPVFVRRAAWRLIGELSGDRGLGTFIALHPELCHVVAVSGAMPDIDTPEDLEGLVPLRP